MTNTSATAERLPPHSTEAEEGALACVLLADGVEAQTRILSDLPAELFYQLALQEIRTACKCLNVNRTPIDGVTLIQWLRDKNLIDAVGGQSYVSGLPEKAPSAANFDYYLGILKDKSARREALQFGTQLIGDAYNEAIEPEAFAINTKRRIDEVFRSSTPPRLWLKFYSPTECREYAPPMLSNLVGDSHIAMGSAVVIAGPPGLGKSRAAVGLGVGGATQKAWMGLAVHRSFKTIIIQAENARRRLKDEFKDINEGDPDDYIRITEPPEYGMAFDHPDFRAQLTAEIKAFGADIVVIDPFNSVARDDKQRDYRDVFEHIRSALPTGDASPSLVIVAHTRKPTGDVRKTGRALLYEVSGSHLLVSYPRSVFIMEAATDDPTDDRVIWTNVKNNDGKMTARSAWHRRNGLFVPVDNFDWDEFDDPEQDSKFKIKSRDVFDALAGRTVKHDRLEDELARQFNVSDRTARSAIARALESKLVKKDSNDFYQQNHGPKG